MFFNNHSERMKHLWKIGKFSNRDAAYRQDPRYIEKICKTKREHPSRYWLGKKLSPEHIAKMIKGKVGFKHSQESKDKISKNNTRYWLGKRMSDETKHKLSMSLLGKPAWNTGKHMSKASKEKLSVAQKKRLQNPKLLEILRNYRAHQKFNKVSSIEFKLIDALTHAGIKHIAQYPITKLGWATVVDIYIPEYNMCVYADGDYWHSLPNYVKRDRKTNRILKNLKYKVIRLWERSINKNTAACINKIRLKGAL